jgi:putative transposase
MTNTDTKLKNTKLENIKNKIYDSLIEEYNNSDKPKDPNDLLKMMSKGILERMMSAELTDYLGYEKHSIQSTESPNYRNGYTPKTIKTNQGDLNLKIPRDRNGEFEPVIIPKGETRFKGFDDKVISLYSSGLTTRDIQDHLKEIHDISVSPDFISKITDAVIQEVREW